MSEIITTAVLEPFVTDENGEVGGDIHYVAWNVRKVGAKCQISVKVDSTVTGGVIKFVFVPAGFAVAGVVEYVKDSLGNDVSLTLADYAGKFESVTFDAATSAVGVVITSTITCDPAVADVEALQMSVSCW